MPQPRLCDRRALTFPHLYWRRCKLRIVHSTEACKTRASSGEEQPDLVERLFGRIFGKQALDERSPGGMKRMSDSALLEQYPATLTEFAAPVNSDDETMAIFRPLLAQTRLQKLPLRLAYSAETHGWSSSAFHEQVNTFGATVILAQTAGGALCGGYNPRGWIGRAW